MTRVRAVLFSFSVLPPQASSLLYQAVVCLLPLSVFVRVLISLFISGWTQFIRQQQLVGNIIHGAHTLSPLHYRHIVGVFLLEEVQVPQQMRPAALMLSLIAVVSTVEVRA